jgi:hypothetical protein
VIADEFGEEERVAAGRRPVGVSKGSVRIRQARTGQKLADGRFGQRLGQDGGRGR